LKQEERAEIRRTVLYCRSVLEEEFDERLRLVGFLANRTLPADRLPADRREIRQQLDLAFERENLPYKEARQRWIRHRAFTFLNRVLALRVAEVHGLITETIIMRPEYGNRSLRERDLADADPVLAVDGAALARRAFGEACLELNIPVLFVSSQEPYGLVEPSLPAYQKVRQSICQVPAVIWCQFESLGWAYQYFNDEMREEIRRTLRRSPTADDIPPLNQFYTVNWIVKFLVENTLGRLWLKQQPDSYLKANMKYFVPAVQDYKQPNSKYKVDEIRVLDPSCGSGHFLLEAFDLLFVMWEEAHPELPKWEIPMKILEHNLYGIDVDLRACQIAALALYLKASSKFEQYKPEGQAVRFSLSRLNIACADVRYVDGQRRQGFMHRFSHDPALQKIVLEILNASEQAYSIGSLLQIKQPLQELFAERKVAYDKAGGRKQSVIPFAIPTQEQQAIGLPVPREETMRDMVNAIKDFIRYNADIKDIGSLFFGLDSERAVHLIDLLTQEYQVILMNPPYGQMSAECKKYARKHYPRTHNDFYAAFVEQAVNLLVPGGYVGALTGRTFMFLKSYEKLREEILRDQALPQLVLDLGFDVLDGATARWAAFTLQKRWTNDSVSWREHPVAFFRLTPWQWDDKRLALEEALSELWSEAGGEISV
jgi:hypothetical protein